MRTRRKMSKRTASFYKAKYVRRWRARTVIRHCDFPTHHSGFLRNKIIICEQIRLVWLTNYTVRTDVIHIIHNNNTFHSHNIINIINDAIRPMFWPFCFSQLILGGKMMISRLRSILIIILLFTTWSSKWSDFVRFFRLKFCMYFVFLLCLNTATILSWNRLN